MNNIFCLSHWSHFSITDTNETDLKFVSLVSHPFRGETSDTNKVGFSDKERIAR
jgi:hypothetical protein